MPPSGGGSKPSGPVHGPVVSVTSTGAGNGSSIPVDAFSFAPPVIPTTGPCDVLFASCSQGPTYNLPIAEIIEGVLLEAAEGTAKVVASSGDYFDVAEWGADKAAARWGIGDIHPEERYIFENADELKWHLDYDDKFRKAYGFDNVAKSTKTFLARAGFVADVVENGLAVKDFAVDPNLKNGYAVVKTGVGTWLMALGPKGWFVKFVAWEVVEGQVGGAIDYVTNEGPGGLASDAVKWERAIVRGMVNLPW